MKRTLSALILTAMLLAPGCLKEEDRGGRIPLSFASIPVGIGQPSPFLEADGTRSLLSTSAETFQKAALFAFGADGRILLDGDAPVVAVTEDENFAWSLPLNRPLDIYALVNYGDLDISALLTSPTLTEADLDALTFTCASQSAFQQLETTGLPMSGVRRGVILADGSVQLTVPVKHLFAKYRIYFDKTALEAAGYAVNGLYISACHSNTEVPFFEEGYRQQSLSKLKSVDLGSGQDLVNLNKGTRQDAVVLYFLENCQGDKGGAEHWYDVAASGMEGLDLCSYIDLGVQVTDADGNDTNYSYWIYLGDDCTTNFDVRRGTERTLHLTLRLPTEKGPAQGVSFVSYRNGSVSATFQNDTRMHPFLGDIPVVAPVYIFFETSVPPENFSASCFTFSNSICGVWNISTLGTPFLVAAKAVFSSGGPEGKAYWSMALGGSPVPDNTSYPYVGVVYVKKLTNAAMTHPALMTISATSGGITYQDHANLVNGNVVGPDELKLRPTELNWEYNEYGPSSIKAVAVTKGSALDGDPVITYGTAGSASSPLVTVNVLLNGNLGCWWNSENASTEQNRTQVVNVTFGSTTASFTMIQKKKDLPEEPDPVTTYTYYITPSAATTEVNGTPVQYRLMQQTYLDGEASGAPTAVGSGVSWSSSATGIATVDATGLATPGANAGTAIITATYEDVSYTATLTTTAVAPPDPVETYRLSLTPAAKDLYEGDSFVYTLTRQRYLDGVASGSPETMPNSSFTWSSSNPAAATVNSAGAVTGGTVSGASPINATVTATLKASTADYNKYLDQAVSGTVTVHKVIVEPVITYEVAIDAPDASPAVYMGHTYQLSARLRTLTDGVVTATADITATALWSKDSDCFDLDCGLITANTVGTGTVEAYYTCPDGIGRSGSIPVTVLYARYELEVSTAAPSNHYSITGQSSVAIPMRANLKEYHSTAAGAPAVATTNVSDATTYTGYNTVTNGDFSGGVGTAIAYRSGPYRITGTYTVGNIPVSGTKVTYVTATRDVNLTVLRYSQEWMITSSLAAPDDISVTLVVHISSTITSEAATIPLPKGQTQASYECEGVLNALPWSISGARFEHASSSYQEFEGDTYEDTTNLITYYLHYTKGN